MAQRRKNLTAMSNPSQNAIQSDSQAIPARKRWSKPRKSIKSPGTKALVIAKRVQGDSKRKIARDLNLPRVTVTSILDESNLDQQLTSGKLQSAGLISRAIGVIETRLRLNSENAAIKVLENTIWPLNEKQGRNAGDPGLTLAIQNLMGNVSVTTTNSALPTEQPKSATLDVVPLPAKTE
jgi:hypothetical protein